MHVKVVAKDVWRMSQIERVSQLPVKSLLEKIDLLVSSDFGSNNWDAYDPYCLERNRHARMRSISRERSVLMSGDESCRR